MKPPFLGKQTKSAKGRSRQTQSTRRVRAVTSPPSEKSMGFIALLTRFTSIILISIIGTGTLLYIKRDQWGVSKFIQTHFSTNTETKPKPDPEKYANLTEQLDVDRTQLRMRYLRARTEIERQKIISEASTLLEDRLPSMMRCWLGHPWDFNGTATVPGEGKIACGYFVSVIMRDAGFNINRIRLAQQPSQNIILTFVKHKNFYEVTSGKPYEEYVDEISEKYEGIHIIGLDTHVAFVVIKDGEMRFIHSGGLQRCVVDEDQNDAYALEKSNYRVISNISRNRNVIKRWLIGENFPTRLSD